MTKQHAKMRPPSAAARWLSCPASTIVATLYERDETDASSKGDKAHQLLENGILFGVQPNTDDADMDLNVIGVLEFIAKRRKELGGDVKVYAEREYDIPETGEFGTADITFVSPKIIEIWDYKNGYVPVELTTKRGTPINPQLMLYLCGAIAEFGERASYRIGVLQPNYDHIDGPYRSVVVTDENLAHFRQEVNYAIHVDPDKFAAGAHCKKTYCEHRGSCASFLDWARQDENAMRAWHPHEVNAISTEQLADVLDHGDYLKGANDEWRKEAIRRIMHHDQSVPGWKVVKGTGGERKFKDDAAKGECYAALLAIGYAPEQLVDRKPFKVGDMTLYAQSELSVPAMERMVKHTFKSFGRGKWKEVWDELFRPHIMEFSGSITLVRATDGRPAHTRGSEFGALVPPPATPTSVTTVI